MGQRAYEQIHRVRETGATLILAACGVIGAVAIMCNSSFVTLWVGKANDLGTPTLLAYLVFMTLLVLARFNHGVWMAALDVSGASVWHLVTAICWVGGCASSVSSVRTGRNAHWPLPRAHALRARKRTSNCSRARALDLEQLWPASQCCDLNPAPLGGGVLWELDDPIVAHPPRESSMRGRWRRSPRLAVTRCAGSSRSAVTAPPSGAHGAAATTLGRSGTFSITVGTQSLLARNLARV